MTSVRFAHYVKLHSQQEVTLRESTPVSTTSQWPGPEQVGILGSVYDSLIFDQLRHGRGRTQSLNCQQRRQLLACCLCVTHSIRGIPWDKSPHRHRHTVHNDALAAPPSVDKNSNELRHRLSAPRVYISSAVNRCSYIINKHGRPSFNLRHRFLIYR